MSDLAPLLLFDDACGLCSATVQFVLEHDRRGTLRFAALGSPVAGRVIARHPELAGVDSVIWVEPARSSTPERAVARSDAALRLARYLGGFWRLATISRIVPRGIRDRAYDWIARHRHRLPGADACYVPPPEVRARFLDQ